MEFLQGRHIFGLKGLMATAAGVVAVLYSVKEGGELENLELTPEEVGRLSQLHPDPHLRKAFALASAMASRDVEPVVQRNLDSILTLRSPPKLKKSAVEAELEASIGTIHSYTAQIPPRPDTEPALATA